MYIDTAGLGGLFGILWALDKPLPFSEANPWKRSLGYEIGMRFGEIAKTGIKLYKDFKKH